MVTQFPDGERFTWNLTYLNHRIWTQQFNLFSSKPKEKSSARRKSRDDAPNCSVQETTNVKSGARPRAPEPKPSPERRIERFIRRATESLTQTYAIDREIVLAELLDIRGKADNAGTTVRSAQYFVTALVARWLWWRRQCWALNP
jgi:hypothetical protein